MERLDLPSHPNSPGQARAFVRRLLLDWQIDDELRQDAELLVTELVTNSIIHAHSDVTVEVSRDGDVLYFGVLDFGPGQVRLRVPSSEDVTGRGLYFLDQLAPNWEVTAAPTGGKTIHFSLTAAPSDRELTA